MDYWTVVLELWTPDGVWRIPFETRFAHGNEYGISDADDALEKAKTKARENGFDIIRCEKMKLSSGTFD